MESTSAAQLLTVKQTREILGIGTTKIYALMGTGVLESVKIGAARRIKRASVDRLAEHGTAPAA